jgi:hypothetical protein
MGPVERHKDILNLHGWLRVNLYNAIATTHGGQITTGRAKQKSESSTLMGSLGVKYGF